MPDILTPALILNRVLYSERDLILTLLTEQNGIVSAIARSARGSRRRFGGCLDIFVVFRARLRLKPHGRLSTLMEAEPLRLFPGILENLERLETGQAMLVVARDILREAPADESTFRQFVKQLADLEGSAPTRTHEVFVAMIIRLLDDIGHAPAGDVCLGCRSRFAKGGDAFLVADGVVLCRECAQDRPATRVGVDLLKACCTVRDNDPDLPRNESITFMTALLSSVTGRKYEIPL